MSKIEKTIARQKQKIDEGQYYEAHQQLRVITSRYVKQENYAAAYDVLSGGAQLLFKAGQGGSGGDLCMYLMEVYKLAQLVPDAASKGRLLSLLRSFPADEPTRKRYVGEIISWSAKFGDYPAGDPELHHVAGQLFAEEGDVYDAERHLTLGTRESPIRFAQLEYDWYLQDDSHTAGAYAGRAVLPYLLVGNLRAANQVLLLFTSRLGQLNPNLATEAVSGRGNELRLYTSLPLLNFLSLLLLAVQRGSSDLFRNLRAQYGAQIKELGTWDEALEQLGEAYFGIKKPRQSNPLFDMMGSMFGGGGGSGGKAAPKPKAPAAAPPPPAID